MKCYFFLFLLFASISIQTVFGAFVKQEMPLEEYAQLIVKCADTDHFIVMIDTLVVRAQKENNDSMELRGYELAFIYKLKNNNANEIEAAYAKCAELCHKLGDNKRLLKNWENLISYYTGNGIYNQKALDELIEYQKLAIEIGFLDAVMYSYYAIGSCYYVWSDYITALHHFKKSIEYGEKHHLKIHYKSYHNIAACARLYGDYELSRSYQLKAIDIYEKQALNDQNMILLLGGLLRDYIAVRDSLGDLVVDSVFSQLQEVARTYPLKVGYNQRRYNDAMFFYYMDYKNNPQMAKKYLNSGKYMMANLNNGRAHYALGEYREAADNYREAYEKTRQIQANQINYNLDKYLEQYDYDRMKSKNDQEKLNITQHELEKEKENALLIHQRNVWQLAFFILAILVISISFIIVVRRHIRKERRLKAEKERAESAEKRKSLFLQNMSHEIRTPLNAIVGFNTLLHGEMALSLSEEDKERMIDMIKTNVELLQTLVSDVLDMSKFESGTYHIRIGPTDVEHLCNTVVESMRDRIKPGVRLNLRCNPAAVVLMTDGQRLQQVLSNYMTNACKYTIDGSITLGYEIIGANIQFYVADTGVGVKLDDAEAIFMRFKMLDKSVAGTGLGLHICRLIAEMLQGKVYLDTSYTQGAKFVFEIPYNN